MHMTQHTVLKLLSSPSAKEVFEESGVDKLLSLPVPSSDRDMLNMRRDDQTKELLRLLQVLQQDVIADPLTNKQVPREQILARARAMSRRLMRSVFTVYLDDVVSKGIEQ
jgi:hypothetical protein